MRQLVTERRTSDEQGFTEFVEQSLPEALADVIDQVRDEWDGSPFFVLATPEHPQLEVRAKPPPPLAAVQTRP
ncbi:MAG: hypothetical protein ACRDLO_12015, partial [Solirubrobacterales bacterium]